MILSKKEIFKTAHRYAKKWKATTKLAFDMR